MENRAPCSTSSNVPPCISEQTHPASSPSCCQQSSLGGQPPTQKGDQGPHGLHPCVSLHRNGSTQNQSQRSAPSCSLGLMGPLGRTWCHYRGCRASYSSKASYHWYNNAWIGLDAGLSSRHASWSVALCSWPCAAESANEVPESGLPQSPPLFCQPCGTSQLSVHESNKSLFQCNDTFRGPVQMRSL